MNISILTLFPDIFQKPLTHSILKKAQEKNVVSYRCINIRDFATDAYKTVDDRPYGGGSGMIMKVDVLDRAIQFAKNIDAKKKNHTTKVILLDPKGETYTQKKAIAYAKLDHLILVCGHYEGIDARITAFVDESLSIGDYVLTGGEIPAMVVVDSVVRLLPNVLATEVTANESFSIKGATKRYLEYPQYTRPPSYKGCAVPSVLLSGDHKKITEWKDKHTIKKK